MDSIPFHELLCTFYRVKRISLLSPETLEVCFSTRFPLARLDSKQRTFHCTIPPISGKLEIQALNADFRTGVGVLTIKIVQENVGGFVLFPVAENAKEESVIRRTLDSQFGQEA